ncbi:MAG: ABC transporter permease subunit [Anaerolineae bacterium]|nr:ABC transporter permease subunit [Anaerolineae bacterium]
MATNRATLNPVTTHGWRMGFANMFRKENGERWTTRVWLRQAIIWLLIINGLLAAVLWSAPRTPANMSDSEREALTALSQTRYQTGLEVFFMVGGMAAATGITIMAQESILDEKRSGTLAWVLSKPVSRTSVFLAKLLAQTVSMLIIIVGLQAVIAYVQLSASKGAPLPALGFMLAAAMLALYVLFYLSLTLMLSVIFDNRGAVLGIPLLIAFGYQFIVGILQGFSDVLPYSLVIALTPPNPSLAMAFATEQPVPSLLPIVSTVVCIIVFNAVAIWRFRKIEF